jgi:hypothetical protein
LDIRVVAPLHTLKELSLYGNPFCCDCELRHIVKWCEERNLSTGATCENGVSWTDFVNENCTSITFIVIGIGVGIIFIVSVVVVVWVCCLRRARRDTVGTGSTSPEDSPDSVSMAYYKAIPSDNQKCPSSCSTHALLLKPTGSSSSAGYAPITQRRDMHHAGTNSNPGKEYGFAVSPTYAESYRHTTDTSVMYAVPYQHTTSKTGESKVSNENVFCGESNNEVYSDEISIRNSLYL